MWSSSSVSFTLSSFSSSLLCLPAFLPLPFFLFFFSFGFSLTSTFFSPSLVWPSGELSSSFSLGWPLIPPVRIPSRWSVSSELSPLITLAIPFCFFFGFFSFSSVDWPSMRSPSLFSSSWLIDASGDSLSVFNLSEVIFSSASGIPGSPSISTGISCSAFLSPPSSPDWSSLYLFISLYGSAWDVFWMVLMSSSPTTSVSAIGLPLVSLSSLPSADLSFTSFAFSEIPSFEEIPSSASVPFSSSSFSTVFPIFVMALSSPLPFSFFSSPWCPLGLLEMGVASSVGFCISICSCGTSSFLIPSSLSLFFSTESRSSISESCKWASPA